MTRRRGPILAAALAVGALLVGVVAFVPLGVRPPASVGPDGTPIVIGGSPLLDQAAPAFSLVDLDGNPVALSDFTGRPVVVNFWASWCLPCRDEFPLLVDAHARYATDGLEVLGVVYKDDAAAARGFATDEGATWPLLADPGESVFNAYKGTTFVPMTVFIDRAGIVRAVKLWAPSEAGLTDYVSRILPAV